MRPKSRMKTGIKLHLFQEEAKQDQKAASWSGTKTGQVYRGDRIIQTGTGRVQKQSENRETHRNR